MRKYLRRPSPAMLIAIAALVWATCGSAIADGVNAVTSALKPNSVTSKTIKNGSISLSDLSKSARKSLQGKAGATGATGATGAQGAQGPAGTPDGYTKTEADGAFLGKTAKAADADKLDGVDGSSFVTGGGSQGFGNLLMTGGDADATLATIPNIGKIIVGCTAGAPESMDVTVQNDQSSTITFAYAMTRNGTSPIVDGRDLTAGNTFNFNLGTVNQQIVFQLSKVTGVGLFKTTNAATVVLTAVTNPLNGTDKCRYQAQVQTGSSGFSFVIFNPLSRKAQK